MRVCSLHFKKDDFYPDVPENNFDIDLQIKITYSYLMYNTSYNLYLGLQRKRSTLLKTSVPSQNLLITSHISQKIKILELINLDILRSCWKCLFLLQRSKSQMFAQLKFNIRNPKLKKWMYKSMKATSVNLLLDLLIRTKVNTITGVKPLQLFNSIVDCICIYEKNNSEKKPENE